MGISSKPAMVIKSACQCSHSECGVLVHIRDGKVISIEGNPDHPMSKGLICPKGRAAIDLIYHQDRLRYPLRRIGARGEGKWQRISWDEALDTIASKLKQIKERYGPLAIVASTGTQPRGNLYTTAQFSRAIGCNLTGPVHICYIPSIIAGKLTIGQDNTQERGPDYDNARCILVWGANPVISHPPRGRDILKAKRKGAKLIVIDPRFTSLASKADIWLQIRPATDDALALGMLNVIINENLYDRAFVDKWCVGFEKLRERVQEYPVERVAEITWVPEEDIRRAARTYAITKPAALHHRVAVEVNTNAIQTLRALYIMIAITGNIDIRGGNLLSRYPPGFKDPVSLLAEKELQPPGTRELLGAERFPLFCGAEAISGPFAHNPTVIKAMLTNQPYPVKALFAFANNVAVSFENSKQVWEALKGLEFMVVADFFMTPTAELADIVLPSVTWLEKDEVPYESYENYIAVRQKAVEPLYECWDDKKIILELAKRMGLKKWFPWDTVEELISYQIRDMGITFADLKEQGYIVEPLKYRKYETEKFKTPSGQVELYSTILERHGYDPLPCYGENPETPISRPVLAQEYPLILITGSKHIAYFHSEGRQIARLRKMCPEPIIEIHPRTAKQLSIIDNDWVWIETLRGRIRQKARLTSGIHPKVCHAQHHWWFPEKPGPDHGCFESNTNVLISNEPPYDPICGATPLRGLLCRIYKAA